MKGLGLKCQTMGFPLMKGSVHVHPAGKSQCCSWGVGPSSQGSELLDATLVSVFLPLKWEFGELERFFRFRVHDAGSAFPCFRHGHGRAGSSSSGCRNAGTFPSGRFPVASLRMPH